MNAELKRLYARAIETPAGKCFCLVRWGPDVDADGFDVTLLHARSMQVYVGRGLRAPPRWIKPDLWVPLAQRALASEVQPEGVGFQFHLDSGALSWAWPAKDVGMSAGAQQSVVLAPVGLSDAGASLEDMLSTVWESCYRLLVSCRQLDTGLQRQADSLTRTRRELQECTEKHKGLVEELHIKFARVLDSKKEKLIEQRDRIQDLEQQLKAAQQELAEAEAAQTEDEEQEELDGTAAGPGTSSAAAALPTVSAPRTHPPGFTAAATAPTGPMAPTNATAAATAATSRTPQRRLLQQQQQQAVAGERAQHLPNGSTPAAVATGPARAEGFDPMDLDGALAGPFLKPAAAQGFARGGALAAAGAAQDMLGPVDTYASLGETQLDDELMLATTQRAVRGAPLVSPLRAWAQEELLPDHPPQGPTRALGTAGLGLAPDAPSSAGRVDGFGGEDSGGDDDDDDDDAALGLGLAGHRRGR